MTFKQILFLLLVVCVGGFGFTIGLENENYSMGFFLGGVCLFFGILFTDDEDE